MTNEKSKKPSICIICPTRNRGDLCARMIDSVRATADSDVEIILGIASKGEVFPAEYFPLQAQKFLMQEMPTVAVVNFLAEHVISNTEHDIVFVACDDVVFKTKGWDTDLIKKYEELENKIHVFCLQDSRDVNGTPHPAVTREFIEAMGYLFIPIFLHWYVDIWLSTIAKQNNCLTILREHLLAHEKPSDIGIEDDTFKRIRTNGFKERDIFVNNRCQHILQLEVEKLASQLRSKKWIKE